MKRAIIEKHSQAMTLCHQHNVIRKLIASELRKCTDLFLLEVRKEKEDISCYVLNVRKNDIFEYRSTRKFFQQTYDQGLLKFAGSYGNEADQTKRGLFVSIDKNKTDPLIINEIKNKIKPTKKQLGILSKAYKQIIYKNARNAQFYIIPSIDERTRVKRYEHVHKNTIMSLIKKGLINNAVGQVYQLTLQARKLLESQAIQELFDNCIIDITIEEWIRTPKLMQEYILRTQGEKK